MRVSAADRERLRAIIAPLDTEERRARYRAGEYPRSDRTKDLDMRYRWDLLWESDGWRQIHDRDLTDVHIDTALRRIIPPLGETS